MPLLIVKEKMMAYFECPECLKILERDRRFKCYKKKFVASYCSIVGKPVVLKHLKGRSRV